jgi:hypothetical protein
MLSGPVKRLGERAHALYFHRRALLPVALFCFSAIEHGIKKNVNVIPAMRAAHVVALSVVQYVHRGGLSIDGCEKELPEWILAHVRISRWSPLHCSL